MKSTSKARGIALAVLVWVVIVGAALAGYKYLWIPWQKQSLVAKTSADSSYKREVVIAADGFSGYAFFRSDTFAKFLRADGIKATVEDDGANYQARMKALADGRVQVAVFTIDAFLKTGALMGDFPATMVLVIDETKGGDAIVAYKDAVPSIEALNSPSAKFVLTPDSPSEFLGRVANASFNLPLLPSEWIEPAKGANDVFLKLRDADKKAKRAYVLWEPYVSRATEDPAIQILLDSSKLKGYVVDVLVIERNFLQSEEPLVATIVEAYLKTLHSYQENPVGLTELIQTDAGNFGETLTPSLAQRVVNGIQWKNTTENYGHFGLLTDAEADAVEHLEDIIPKIVRVLVQTDAIPTDPTGGKPTSIFYNGILKGLQAKGFHPGKRVDVLEGAGLGAKDLPKVTPDAPLPTLNASDWSGLKPVGSMRVEPISFTRGTATLTVQSTRDLDDLARKLKSFPGYYILVVGSTAAQGDVSANTTLAQARADAAGKHLASLGINTSRIKADVLLSRGATEVSFVLMEKPK